MARRIPDEDIPALLRDSIARYAGALRRLGYGPTNRVWPCPHRRRAYDLRVKREWCEDCFHWTS